MENFMANKSDIQTGAAYLAQDKLEQQRLLQELSGSCTVVPLKEAREKLGHLIERTRRRNGQPTLITHHGKPWGVIVPVGFLVDRLKQAATEVTTSASAPDEPKLSTKLVAYPCEP
jgi:prevent-host-death family protein